MCRGCSHFGARGRRSLPGQALAVEPWLGEQFHWCTCEISVDLLPGMKGACYPVQEIKYSFMMFKIVLVVVIFVAPLHQLLVHRANPQPLPEARFL